MTCTFLANYFDVVNPFARRDGEKIHFKLHGDQRLIANADY